MFFVTFLLSKEMFAIKHSGIRSLFHQNQQILTALDIEPDILPIAV